MTLKLYFSPRTRATRPRWLLEELGVSYELVRLDMKAGDHKKPEYLAVHPLGSVPALADGDIKIFESAAICLYLADKFADKGLAPAPGTPLRGAYYQWIVFAVTTLEPPVGEYASHALFLPPEKRDPVRAEKARENLEKIYAVLAGALQGNPFLTGKFSAADVMIASILNWARSMKLLDEQPVLLDYVNRLVARPAAARANA